RNHHVNIDDFPASTEMALDEDGLLSSMLEGESPGLDPVVDLSTFSKSVDQLTLDNSVPVDLFQSDPKESHLFAVKRIIKYVSRTFEFRLWYTYDTCVNLVRYSDVDWAGCSDDSKSTSEGVFYVGNNLVAWHSKKQNFVSLSTAEAEYVAALNSVG
ncbi:unnamed protein product, partial [Prunus brigantina]